LFCVFFCRIYPPSERETEKLKEKRKCILSCPSGCEVAFFERVSVSPLASASELGAYLLHLRFCVCILCFRLLHVGCACVAWVAIVGDEILHV
jgi:hypothetical protein